MERFPSHDSTISLSLIPYHESSFNLESLLGRPDPHDGNRTTRSPTVKQTTSAEFQVQENTFVSCIERSGDQICRRFTLVCCGEGPGSTPAQMSAPAFGSARARRGSTCLRSRLAHAGICHLGHPQAKKDALRATLKVWDRSFDLGRSGGGNGGSNPSSGLWSRSSLVR